MVIGFRSSRLSFKDKTIAITGASGTLGRSLLRVFHAQGARLIALSSGTTAVTLPDIPDDAIRTVFWKIGEESLLDPLWAEVDILVLNHGINVHSDRSSEALTQSYEVNTFSHWRLLNNFLAVNTPDRSHASGDRTSAKEIWVNTSEAEVNPAFSPLYELSKRTLGDWLTLKRLDSPYPLRKLILGPFRSALNPVGIMDADRVAQQIVTLAQRDVRNIIVTINPLTPLLFPIREALVSQYFQWFTRASVPNDQTRAS
jgi:monoglucosyldiacylglycerol epimerase